MNAAEVLEDDDGFLYEDIPDFDLFQPSDLQVTPMIVFSRLISFQDPTKVSSLSTRNCPLEIPTRISPIEGS